MTGLLLTTGLATLVGFQFGVMTTWRYYKRQRDNQAALRRRYEREIDVLEQTLERAERRLWRGSGR